MHEELLVPFLAFASVAALGGAVLLTRAGRQSLQARLHDARDPDKSAARFGGAAKLLQSLGAFTPGVPSAALAEQLARAGYFGTAAPAAYLGSKMLLALTAGASVLLALAPLNLPLRLHLLAVLGAACIAYLLPNMLVGARRRSRSARIRSHLPDAVDLLEICVSAGMGLDMAWNSVADEVRPVCPDLADEMALANLEIHLGAPRAAAMRHMAQRTEIEELSSLVAVLVQSERFGTSIAEALRVFAGAMREMRRSRAEEAAERMAVKLLFPMVLFIFPTILIVTAGPAGIKVAALLTGD